MFLIKKIRPYFIHFLGLISILFYTIPVLGQTNPEFQSTPIESATYGVLYQYSITVFDLDGDEIEVKIQSGTLPAGISLVENTGNYFLQGTPSETGNFTNIVLEVYETGTPTNSSTQTFDINVSKATQTITFDAISDKAYGDTDISLSATSSAGLPVTYTVTSGPATLAGNSLSITGAGEISVQASQDGNTNVEPATAVTRTFNVTKALLTVTAEDKNIVFGQAIPTLTLLYTGFVNGDEATDLTTAPTPSTAADGSSNAGNYSIEVSGGVSDNYSFDYNSGNLNIAKATQTITFDAISDKTYGDAAITLSATSSAGLPITYTVTSGPATLAGNILSITGAGEISVQASQDGNTNVEPAPAVSRTFNVAKALLTVTAEDKNIVFGQAIPTLTLLYAGFVNGDEATDLTTAPTPSTAADGSSNAGNYSIEVSGGVSENYSFDYNSGNLNIAKATQTITFDAISDKTYGDAAITLSATSSAGLPITYTVTSGPATLVGNNLSITGAGEVTVQASQDGNTNVEPAPAVTRTFNVAKALLTVTAEDKNIVFGQAIPTLTLLYAGFVNGDQATDLTTAPTPSTAADGSSNAGNYSIEVSGGVSDNYSFDYNSGNLNIAKATQTITFDAISDKTYGDAAITLSATSSAGLPITYTVTSGPAALAGTSLSITGAGEISVQASQDGNTNVDPAPAVTRTFNVTKALLTVTAEDKNIVFGQAIPTLTLLYTGFVNGDQATDLTTAPTPSTAADGSSNAGNYSIEVSGGVSDNYSFDYNSGNLNIAKATQTITFDAISDKTYGDAAITLSATSSAGLPITYTVTSGPAALAGTSLSITGAGEISVQASQDGNTNVDPAPAVTRTFNVTKALLTVTAEDKNIVFGQAIPTLTLLYTGFVNGDQATDLTTAPTPSTTADGSSNAGNYSIEVSGGVSDNYSFDYNSGNLNIAKATQTITFDAISDKTYGDAAITLSATSSAGLPITYTVTSGPATLAGNSLSITGAGEVTVQATQAGNANFEAATPNNQSFEVIKATADIQVTNTLQNFDGSPKEVFVTTNPQGLDFNITYNGNTSPPSNAGTYTIEVNIVDNNYSGQSISELIINSAPVSSNIPNQQVNEDTELIQINLWDYFSDNEDEDLSLTFSIRNNSNVEIFSKIEIKNHFLELSIEKNKFGKSDITVRCTDSNNLFVEDIFEVEILAVQDPPFFTSSPKTQILQDKNYQYLITAEDYDPGDELSISNIISLPTWLSLIDNGDGTAVLSGSTNNSIIGVYGIAIRVSDDQGNSANQFFDIEVINVNDPPVFTSNPLNEAMVDELYSYNISTQDIDESDEVSLFAIAKPTWLDFSTESLPQGSAVLTGIPTNQDRNSLQYVEIVAVDLQEDSTFQKFTIEIDFPNTAPFFASEPLKAVNQGEEYEYQIIANDNEDDPITVTAVTIPNWLDFDEENVIVSGSPSNENVGEHNITLEAEDFFGLTTTQVFTIEVINVNDAPSITSTPDTIAIQNQLYEYRIETEDIDENDKVEITLNKKPAWLDFDNESLLSGTPTIDDVEKSPFEVELQATDSAGEFVLQSFRIFVQLENLPPTIDTIDNPDPVNEDSEENFIINLTGITDGGEKSQDINLSLSSDNETLFQDLYIDYESPQNSASLFYTLLADSFGVANITVRVEDNGPSSINFVETTFQIEVLPVNDKPVIISTPIERTLPNEFYSYEIIATDADPEDKISFTKLIGPDWLSLREHNEQTAILEGQVPADATTEEISISVGDLKNESSTQSFSLKINEPPVVSNFMVQTKEDTPYLFKESDFTESYSDTEGDEIEELKLFFTRGSIELNGESINSGDAINFNQEMNLQFNPPANFFGNISIDWSASDGFIHSELASILIEVDTVNDNPILSNIENTILEFIQGSQPILVTQSITVSDIDNLTADSAWVQIAQNYNSSEDKLILSDLNLNNISSKFDQNSGTLIISGNASKSDYELILRSVSYQNTNPLSNDINIKSISFKIGDDEVQSEAISREVQLTNVLPELDFVNAFTPDGNGVNDTWDFKNLEAFEQVNISVFNTQGVRVYNCTSNDCEWDGNFNQEELPAGTYFYLIKLNNGRRKYEGNVTILR